MYSSSRHSAVRGRAVPVEDIPVGGHLVRAVADLRMTAGHHPAALGPLPASLLTCLRLASVCLHLVAVLTKFSPFPFNVVLRNFRWIGFHLEKVRMYKIASIVRDLGCMRMFQLRFRMFKLIAQALHWTM